MSDLIKTLLDIAKSAASQPHLGITEWKPSGLPAPTQPQVRPTTRKALLEEPIGKLPDWPRRYYDDTEHCIHGRIGTCMACLRDELCE